MNGRYRALLLAGSAALHAGAGILGISAAPRAGGLAPLIVYLQTVEALDIGRPERAVSVSPAMARARLAGVSASVRAVAGASTAPASPLTHARPEEAAPEPASIGSGPPSSSSRAAGESEPSTALVADSPRGSGEGAAGALSPAGAAPSSDTGAGRLDAALSEPRGAASSPSSGSSPSGTPSASRASGGGGGEGNPSRLARATPGGEGNGIPAQYGGYLSRFRRSVQEALRYPLAARRRGLEGVVQLDVEIDPSGRVESVEVAASSSHALLDEAAVDAVKSLAPLPLPEHLPARALRVRLPLVFRLE